MSICGHYWDEDAASVKCIGIDMIPVIGKHAGERIKEEMNRKLASLSLRPDSIVRFVTDGASNMRTAFFNPYSLEIEETIEEAEEETGAEIMEVNLDRLFYNEIEETDEDDRLVFISKQSPCAAHLIQLALRDTFDKDREMLDLRSRIFDTIARFSKSHSALSELSPERMFSQLTLHSSGHKGNSNAGTIRRKVLMAFNKRLIE